MILWFFIAATAGQVSPEPLAIDISSKDRIEVNSGAFVVFADEAAATDAAWFDELNAAAGGGLRRTTVSRYRDNEFAFYIGVAGQHASFRERRLRRWLDDVPGVSAQGYRLMIDRRGVVVAGADDAGVRNGVATLIQLFGADASLPQTRIRDEPELAFRAVRLRGRPDAARIADLANAKCNAAILESPDWWTLEPVQAESWRATFSALRAAGIEPIPAIDPSSGAEALLARMPSVAQTQMAIDQLILADDAWSPLTHSTVIESEASPVRVRANGEYFSAGRDYEIAPAETGAADAPWRIRRIANGAIPASELVDVIYSYVPAEDPEVNPLTPEYQAAVRDAVQRVVNGLNPRYLHIGHPNANIINRRRGERDPFAESLKAMVDAAGDKVQLIAYANAYRDPRAKDYVSLLPRNALLDIRTSNGPPPIGSPGAPDIAWARTLDRPLLLSIQADQWDALPSLEAAARAQNVLGIIADDIGAAKIAWGPTRSNLPWPHVLNEYFGTRLWSPDDIEAFEALVAHANEETVRGVAPERELESFRRWFEKNRGRLPAKDAEFVEGHYTRILEWVKLESEFRRGDGRNTLRALTDLVQRHAAAIPEYPENRRSTIVHTIDSAGRFVPSMILFGAAVLPYRAINLPAGNTILEIPVRPEFMDRQGATEAKFDLLESPGPIIRVDFDTLDPSAISVDRSVDGTTFENVQRWERTATTNLGPPVFVQRPFSAAAFTVTVEGDPPVLRDPRVFGLKDVPAAVCSQTVRPPELDGVFRESCWPKQPQMSGFVETTQNRFATVATTIRLTFTRDALYLGVYAREPRMSTMVADIADRDGPLWTEEAIDIRLGVGNDEFVFVTNPSAVQFDSKNGNAEWDARWTVRTQRFTAGWSAEIELPFEILGKQPRSGDDWRFDAVRYRRNVEQSTSHWAYRPDAEERRATGRLIFN